MLSSVPSSAPAGSGNAATAASSSSSRVHTVTTLATPAASSVAHSAAAAAKNPYVGRRTYAAVAPRLSLGGGSSTRQLYEKGNYRAGASYAENIGLFEYVFSLPASVLHFLFASPSSCIACFSCLCELDQLIVLRLLFLQQQVSERAMRLWVSAGSAPDLRRALQRLVFPYRMLLTSSAVPTQRPLPAATAAAPGGLSVHRAAPGASSAGVGGAAQTKSPAGEEVAASAGAAGGGGSVAAAPEIVAGANNSSRNEVCGLAPAAAAPAGRKEAETASRSSESSSAAVAGKYAKERDSRDVTTAFALSSYAFSQGRGETVFAASAGAAVPGQKSNSNSSRSSCEAQGGGSVAAASSTQYALEESLKGTLLQLVLCGAPPPTAATAFLLLPPADAAGGNSVFFPSKQQLLSHSRQQWDALLRFIVEGERAPSSVDAAAALSMDSRAAVEGETKKKRRLDRVAQGYSEDVVKVLTRRRLLSTRSRSRKHLLRPLEMVFPPQQLSSNAAAAVSAASACPNGVETSYNIAQFAVVDEKTAASKSSAGSGVAGAAAAAAAVGGGSGAAMSREAFSWILKDLKSQISSLIVEYLFLIDGGLLTNAAYEAALRQPRPAAAHFTSNSGTASKRTAGGSNDIAAAATAAGEGGGNSGSTSKDCGEAAEEKERRRAADSKDRTGLISVADAAEATAAGVRRRACIPGKNYIGFAGSAHQEADAVAKDMQEVLLLILTLGQAAVGQPIAIKKLTYAQRRFLLFAFDLGLVWASAKATAAIKAAVQQQQSPSVAAAFGYKSTCLSPTCAADRAVIECSAPAAAIITAPAAAAQFVFSAPYAVLLRPDRSAIDRGGFVSGAGAAVGQQQHLLADSSLLRSNKQQLQEGHEGGSETQNLCILDVPFFPLVVDEEEGASSSEYVSEGTQNIRDGDGSFQPRRSQRSEGQSICLFPSASSSVASPLSAVGLEAGMLVQSNFKVYVYTASALQMSVLSHLCELQARLPNLIVGVLTRASVLSAYKSGITAEQIIRFLEAHAHPVIMERKLRSNTPILPENVTIQLRMWEAERMRLSLFPCVLLKKWDSQFMPELFQRSARWACAKNYAIYFTPWPEEVEGGEGQGSSHNCSPAFQEWMRKEKYLAIHADYKPEMVEKIRNIRDSILKRQAELHAKDA